MAYKNTVLYKLIIDTSYISKRPYEDTRQNDQS